jgi:hypothetical protein
MWPDPLIESHVLDDCLNKASELVRDIKHKDVLIYQLVSREEGHWLHEKSRVVAIVSWNFDKEVVAIRWMTDRKSAERYEARYCL